MDLRGRPFRAHDVVPRAAVDVADAAERVQPIIDDVRHHGADAVARWSLNLDGVVPPTSGCRPPNYAERPMSWIRLYVLRSPKRFVAPGSCTRPSVPDVDTQVVPGGSVTQRWVPVERVGLYVPGGRAVYPSSVVMNVVPAQVAGVASLVVVSPPQRDHGGGHTR